MTWPAIIVVAVAIQRIAELIYSARNGKSLRARGAVEVGAGHYPVLVAVHVAWFLTIWAGLDSGTVVRPVWLAVFLLLQLGRAWVLITLGGYWTTRLYHLERVPLLRRGPYRLLRHPNYLIVAGEIAALPLAFGLWRTAVLFSLLNGAVLLWRMRIENRLLDRRVPERPVSMFPSR